MKRGLNFKNLSAVALLTLSPEQVKAEPYIGAELNGKEFRTQLAQPQGFVTDAGHMIPDEIERLIEAHLQAYETETGNEIAVFTITTSNGVDLHEWFSSLIQENRAWRFGKFTESNGVTIVLARDDRRWEIEVGTGVNDDLTNREANRIGVEELVPNLKNGNAAQALQDAIEAIKQELGTPQTTPPLAPTAPLTQDYPTPDYTYETSLEEENKFKIPLGRILISIGLLGSMLAGGYSIYRRRQINQALKELDQLDEVLKTLKIDLSAYPDWVQKETRPYIVEIEKAAREFREACAEASILTAGQTVESYPKPQILDNLDRIKLAQDQSEEFEAKAAEVLATAEEDSEALRSTIVEANYQGFDRATAPFHTQQIEFTRKLTRQKALLKLAEDDSDYYREIYKDAKHISAESRRMVQDILAMARIRDQVNQALPDLETKRSKLARQEKSYRSKLQNLRKGYPASAWEDLEQAFGQILPDCAGAQEHINEARDQNSMTTQEFDGALKSVKKAKQKLEFIETIYFKIDDRTHHLEASKEQAPREIQQAYQAGIEASEAINLDYVSDTALESYRKNAAYFKTLKEKARGTKVDWILLVQEAQMITQNFNTVSKRAKSDYHKGTDFYDDLQRAERLFTDSDVGYSAESMLSNAKALARQSNNNWTRATQELKNAIRRAKSDIRQAEQEREDARQAASISSASSSSFTGAGGGSYNGGGSGGSW